MKRLILLFAALMFVNSAAFSQSRTAGKVQTIVIDPGHGGDKPGAISNRIVEKDLVLEVSKRFGKLIEENYPEVNIIYTHTTDKDISLADRAHIANRNKADLFISIHANSHPTAQPSGVETFVMGLSQSRANMEVAKKENADILLEAGYKDNEAYSGFDPNSPESNVMFAMYQNAYLDKSLDFAQYIQSEYQRNIKSINRGVKQAELFVLYKTTCPSVLTEIGFISNPDEEAFLLTDEGKSKIALCLFNAFVKYKSNVENTKIPTNLKIDLPGLGKNKTNAQAAAEAQRVSDSLAAAKIEQAVETIIENPKSGPEAPKPGTIETAPATFVPVTPAMGKAMDMDEAAAKANNGEVEGLSFRVQFLVSDKELPEGDRQFKGLTGWKMYQQDGSYRYTMGDEPNMKKAIILQNEVRGRGFKDAFVIAMYKGKRISIQEARKMQNEALNQ